MCQCRVSCLEKKICGHFSASRMGPFAWVATVCYSAKTWNRVLTMKGGFALFREAFGKMKKPLVADHTGSSRGGYRTEKASLAVRSAATDYARRVLPIIVELRCAGIISLGKITSELRRRGVPTARGGRWHRMTVSRVLGRRILAECPLTRREVFAIRQNVATEYARGMTPLIERLVASGFNTTNKLSVELNRINKSPPFGGKWSGSRLSKYLRRRCPEAYATVKCGCAPRWERAETEIDCLMREGITNRSAIAEHLNENGIPTPWERPWNKARVQEFLRKTNRTKTLEWHESRTERIKPRLHGIVHQGVKGGEAIAEQLNKKSVPTQSGGCRPACGWN
jgi:hypothetical protein